MGTYAKKYNLNKYNCYDYALELYNSIPGTEALPTLKVKFPFKFGRGGSPCGLYKVLKELSSSAHGLNVGIVMKKEDPRRAQFTARKLTA